jgi:hypothetical protein
MEKFDGVRVFWNGEKLYANTLKMPIDLPQEWKFPDIPFEGELWYSSYYIDSNTFKDGLQSARVM